MKLNIPGFTKENPLRVAIADDHMMFRMGFVALINAFENTTVIFEAENGKHVLELLESKQPDILFLDINMPIMNGMEACIKVREQYPKLSIFALSVYEEAEKIIGMVDAGVNGFLLKKVEIPELEKALKAMVESGYYFCEEAVEALMKKGDNPIVKSFKLTQQEADLLRMLCREMTMEAIAIETNIGLRSIQRFVEELKLKLRVRSRTGMVVYAMRNGFFK